MTTASSDLGQAMARFFDEFVDAFRHFDGPLIAQRYLAPYSALHAGGAIDLLTTPADIGDYFERIVAGYHAEGCRACRYSDLAFVAVGSQSAFATVTWTLLRDDGQPVSDWRESYNLTRTAAGWRIVASMDHVG